MPFDPSAITAPFRMQPGLRRLGAGAVQLHANPLGSAHLEAKLRVLQDVPSQALCGLPGWDAGPALQAMCTQALSDLPAAWGRTARGGWEARLLGWSLEAGQPVGTGPVAIGKLLQRLPPPQRLPALLALAVREDLAVVDGRDATVPWLAVCLPSHWAPTAKLGRPLAEVHAPVADNALLITASASLARLVSGPERWERFVWTLTPSAELDAHPQRHPTPAWPEPGSPDGQGEALAARTWLRTERQTFIPVPGHPQAVFTIEVEVQPLVNWLQQHPEAAAPMAAALASMSEAVLAYRGLAVVRAPLLAWLGARTDPAR